jgi:hypothetical protein
MLPDGSRDVNRQDSQDSSRTACGVGGGQRMPGRVRTPYLYCSRSSLRLRRFKCSTARLKVSASDRFSAQPDIPVPNPGREPNRCNLEPLKRESPRITPYLVLARGRRPRTTDATGSVLPPGSFPIADTAPESPFPKCRRRRARQPAFQSLIHPPLFDPFLVVASRGMEGGFLLLRLEREAGAAGIVGPAPLQRSLGHLSWAPCIGFVP